MNHNYRANKIAFIFFIIAVILAVSRVFTDNICSPLLSGEVTGDLIGISCAIFIFTQLPFVWVENIFAGFNQDLNIYFSILLTLLFFTIFGYIIGYIISKFKN